MIAYLRGSVARLEPSYAVIECHGVGYKVLITLNTFGALKGQQDACVLTYFHVTDSAQVLYGFADERERGLFEALLSISGVGGAIALTILSSLPPDQLEAAIHNGEVERLQAVKGIGKKTAGRILLELQGKLPASEAPPAVAGAQGAAGMTQLRREALEALLNLGFARNQVEERLDALLQDENGPTTVEGLIKAVLRST
jgi:Holliday junction DNA helicase RuvA